MDLLSAFEVMVGYEEEQSSIYPVARLVLGCEKSGGSQKQCAAGVPGTLQQAFQPCLGKTRFA
jgi:hypothetical protein